MMSQRLLAVARSFSRSLGTTAQQAEGAAVAAAAAAGPSSAGAAQAKLKTVSAGGPGARFQADELPKDGKPFAALTADEFIFTRANGSFAGVKIKDMKPTKKPGEDAKGKWISPKVSRLAIARLRRQALDAGHKWPFEVAVKNKPVVLKGHKHDAGKEKKYETIEKNMADMPAKIEEYYKQMRARRQHLLDPSYVLQHGFGRMK